MVLTANDDDAGRLLDGFRQYLLIIANDVIGPELQAKLGASDVVQDTFLEAQRHMAVFRGKTSAETRAWLRKILECRVANIRRFYLATEKRAARREVKLDQAPCRVRRGTQGHRKPRAISEQPRRCETSGIRRWHKP